MTSITWFWTIVIILLFSIVRVWRRYIGRIFLFLFVLFFIFKWINPAGAELVSQEILNFPSKITSFFGKTVSNEVVISSDENLSEEEKSDLNAID